MCLRRSGVLAALVAVLFVAGCAGSQAGSTSTAPSAQPSAVEPSAAPPSESSPSAGPTSTQPPAGKATASGTETLSGTVEAGVEPGCLVLKGTGKDHLLLFAQAALKAQAKVGSAITVVGEARPTQLTTCQQGIPFLVTSIRAN